MPTHPSSKTIGMLPIRGSCLEVYIDMATWYLPIATSPSTRRILSNNSWLVDGTRGHGKRQKAIARHAHAPVAQRASTFTGKQAHRNLGPYCTWRQKQQVHRGLGDHSFASSPRQQSRRLRQSAPAAVKESAATALPQAWDERALVVGELSWEVQGEVAAAGVPVGTSAAVGSQACGSPFAEDACAAQAQAAAQV